MRTESVSTSLGATPVRRIGSGPPVLVFHGGPGFSHDYLIEPLRFLAGHRQLIFFDQPGCGETPAPAQGATLAATIRHAAEVLEAVSDGKKIGTIAHSWGALVLAGALAQASGSLRISEGILVNPTAVNRRDYETARRSFSRRVPLGTKLKILVGAMTRADGTWIMKQLMPFYVGAGSASDVPVIRLNLRTYRSVDASLGDFDFTPALNRLERTAIVLGSADFTTPAEIQALTAVVPRVETLPGAGHFPFVETPVAFRQAAKRAFGIFP